LEKELATLWSRRKVKKKLALVLGQKPNREFQVSVE
jgi:hypothetical protein